MWPLYAETGGRPSAVIKDSFQAYILNNLVDIMIVRGACAPNPNCKPLNTMLVPEILNQISAIITTDSAAMLLSIAKCGIMQSYFDIDSWKHDRPTPGM